jgi:hypothetical protein
MDYLGAIYQPLLCSVVRCPEWVGNALILYAAQDDGLGTGWLLVNYAHYEAENPP